LRIAIATPTVSDEINSIGKFPIALKKIAVVNTVRATAMTRLVPPILPTKGMRNALPAKHSTDKEVRKESRNALKLYCSLRIGISGLITVKPARIFIAAINIGKPFAIASLLLIAVWGTALDYPRDSPLVTMSS
jgi:hypothetical protein